MSDSTHTLNRKAVVAGRFYPSSQLELTKEIRNHSTEADRLCNQNIPEEADLLALVSPHAGYVYSGTVAASAFNRLKNIQARKRVFLIGSSHQVEFNGASVYHIGNYQTPLGEIETDFEVAEQLIGKYDVFTFHHNAHQTEHTLEVQLPFLQYHWGTQFSIVPVILATHKAETCKEFADQLRPFFNDENLFIISTDLSHYPPYDQANSIDKATVDAISSGDPDLFLAQLKLNKTKRVPNLATSICGWTSILTLMYMTQQIENIKYLPILYQNSGDSHIYGEKDRVVGYQSIAIYKNQHE